MQRKYAPELTTSTGLLDTTCSETVNLRARRTRRSSNLCRSADPPESDRTSLSDPRRINREGRAVITASQALTHRHIVGFYLITRRKYRFYFRYFISTCIWTGICHRLGEKRRLVKPYWSRLCCGHVTSDQATTFSSEYSHRPQYLSNHSVLLHLV